MRLTDLQPHDPPPPLQPLLAPLEDLLLGHVLAPRMLVRHPVLSPNQVQYFLGHQSVDDDVAVGIGDDPMGRDREEVGIPRAGAHEGEGPAVGQDLGRLRPSDGGLGRLFVFVVAGVAAGAAVGDVFGLGDGRLLPRRVGVAPVDVRGDQRRGRGD